MPNPFNMEYELQNHTAVELYDKLQTVKLIEKMKLNFVKKNEYWIEYFRGATFSQSPFRIIVAFRDLEGGGVRVVISSMLQQLFGNDRGQNEKNCIEIRNAIASVLK